MICSKYLSRKTRNQTYYISKKAIFFFKNFHQFKIIFYFKFAINQIKSISQISKISNSKNFQQHTFAKSIRHIFNKWFKKSINLLYKTTTFFHRLFISFVSKITNILLYKMFVIFRFNLKIEIVKISIKQFIIRIFFNISNFRHVCRICNDIFESNNVLHRHLKTIYFNQTSRRHLKNFRKCDHLDRNLENSWLFDEKTNRFFLFFHVLLIDFSKNESHVFVTRYNENVVIFIRWWHLLR